MLDYFSVGAFDTALEAAIERRGRVIRPRMFVNPETVETTPLGRAETVLFYGLFTNRIAAAKTAFAEIETAYNARRDAAFTVARQPSTMLNTPFVFDDGFSWSFPGGDSYTAAFLRDANVDYRFQSNGATTSTTFIAPAEIFSNFASADYWINIAKFQDQFENVDAVLADLAAAPINMNGSRFESIQCDNAWGNDKDLRSKGVPDPKGSANNYFELGVVRPDLILADLVDVFHPGAIPNHTMTFYRKIPRGSNTLVCPLADLPATAPAGQALTTTSAVVSHIVPLDRLSSTWSTALITHTHTKREEKHTRKSTKHTSTDMIAHVQPFSIIWLQPLSFASSFPFPPSGHWHQPF